MGKLKGYFDKHEFTPNPDQNDALQYIDGPLLLVAGPGSGKTRVLLWRAFNLIVFHGVKPSEIFLSTFTEKAAKQLKDGLLTLLGSVEGPYFDTSEMYIGTVHSLCRRILSDRRFNPQGTPVPELMDEVDQYFHIYRSQFWNQAGQTEEYVIQQLKPFRGNSRRHQATIALRDLFNRLSEECISPDQFMAQDEALANMYRAYLTSLGEVRTDMSLLQQKAFQILQNHPASQSIFKHVLIDEYQDTNAVQEKIFFHLAQKHKNLCVVGDDDQALYRFRGATVENLVQFPTRCLASLGKSPERINLLTNYRSSPKIVDFYNRFMETHVDWQGHRFGKTIKPNNHSEHTAVVVTSKDNDNDRCQEIAALVEKLIQQGRVNDPNQIAFLYPSVKSPLAKTMIGALESRRLSVYSPRSGQFLQCEEAKLVFGLFIKVLGRPEPYDQGKYVNFQKWLDECEALADNHITNDINKFIKDKNTELGQLLLPLQRTSWNLLDLFYQFLDLDILKNKLVSAENDGDEGEICNLSLISQYLFRFQTMHQMSVVEGEHLGPDGEGLHKSFFRDYLYGLYRLQESDYEDSDNPFPKGRIPFLTIHQAKGLEFPVVILGDLQSFTNRFPVIENIVRPLIPNNNSLEDINQINQFDAMRMFYVAISRAENLLVLANASKNCHPGLAKVIDEGITGHWIVNIDEVIIDHLPTAKPPNPPLPKTYSYTADYQAYLTCPRHYMLFRKYGFAPSRTRTMAFGVLVHKTIEDLHHWLIANSNAIDLPTNFISQRITENYSVLRHQTSHQLSAANIDAARRQVEEYWRKLPNIARSITATEVPLTLTNQKTPEDRTYSIFGVVDMEARDPNAPHLYDIKTHLADDVRANPQVYEDQLNVYAHIWQKLHGVDLSGTSIIATKLPEPMSPEWNPLIPLKFNADFVASSICKFGTVVDKIEAREFQPRPVNDLQIIDQQLKRSFAQEVCSRCDGRFSCASYVANHQIRPLTASPTINPVREAPHVALFRERFMDPACKDAYLNEPSVRCFINYFEQIIRGNICIKHKYKVERVNQDFLKKNVGKLMWFTRLESAFRKYVWKQQDYNINKGILGNISNSLHTAIRNNNLMDFYLAALACLEWGTGNKRLKLYSANREWLWKRSRTTNLIQLFQDSFNVLSSRCPNLAGFEEKYRMNSGFTKIYSLSFDDFIIYDSRVAAALGRLVTLYCAQSGLTAIPGPLKFSWSGTDKDKLKRNPSVCNYQFGRINNNSVYHAEWNIKANWLLKAVVERFGDGGFWELNDPQECLRALEAALFMVGYDVSIHPKAVVNASKAEHTAPLPEQEESFVHDEEELDFELRPNMATLWGIPIRKGTRNIKTGELDNGWVPCGHNFTEALAFYYAYALSTGDKTASGYKDFIQSIERPNGNQNTVGGNDYVQNRNELKLNKQSLPLIKDLFDSWTNRNITKGALCFLNSYRDRPITEPNSQWPHFPKYLMCTYLVSILEDYTNAERKSLLIKLKYAGTDDAAQAIISVGRSFGRHFGFLDDNYSPTDLFRHYYFGIEPLENWMHDVIR